MTLWMKNVTPSDETKRRSEVESAPSKGYEAAVAASGPFSAISRWRLSTVVTKSTGVIVAHTWKIARTASPGEKLCKVLIYSNRCPSSVNPFYLLRENHKSLPQWRLKIFKETEVIQIHSLRRV